MSYPEMTPTKVKKVTVIMNVEMELSYTGEYTDEDNADWITHQLSKLETEISNCHLVDKAEIEDIERR